MDWIANCLNIKNTLPYFCVSNCRTYGSLENTTAGGTPYPHSSFGARSRPSPSRVRLVFLCFRVYWLYYEGILDLEIFPFIFIDIDFSNLKNIFVSVVGRQKEDPEKYLEAKQLLKELSDSANEQFPYVWANMRKIQIYLA